MVALLYSFTYPSMNEHDGFLFVTNLLCADDIRILERNGLM